MNRRAFLGFLAGLFAISTAACGNTEEVERPLGAPVATNTEAINIIEEKKMTQGVSVDFEDSNIGFVKLYTREVNADHSELSVVDYHGSKALYVQNVEGKNPYVAFDISSMLGEDVAKVASIEMTIGTEHSTGAFSAISGHIVSWAGAELTEYKDVWSVYMADKNPNRAIAKIGAGEEFVSDASNIIIVTIDTDNGLTEGNGNANLYIDNICFLDAEGKVLQANTTVEFVAPNGFESAGKDLSNLVEMTDTVEFEGFQMKEAGWAQNGLEMPQEIIDALVPGAVVELEYKSDNGDIWIVMPDAQVGWTRVGDGNNGTAAINDSCSIAQITYEQIAEFCGEDKTLWGARMQAEASGAWEVFSVKVGKGVMK